MVKIVSCSGEDCHSTRFATENQSSLQLLSRRSSRLIVAPGATRLVSVALTVVPPRRNTPPFGGHPASSCPDFPPLPRGKGDCAVPKLRLLYSNMEINTSFPGSLSAFQESLTLTLTNLLTSIFVFLPRFLASLIILVIGIALSRWVKKVIVSSLEKIRLSAEVEKTPIQSFLKNADVTTKIEVIIANAVYWILLLIVLQASMSVLGLAAISAVLNHILLYIPNVFSALLILIFGILLAGIAEAVVKGAVKAVDGKSARILGTVTSYFIMILAIMASISELGIAQQFITILFTGLVASATIALGLAFGLGSKDTVSKLMDEWYSRMRKE